VASAEPACAVAVSGDGGATDAESFVEFGSGAAEADCGSENESPRNAPLVAAPPVDRSDDNSGFTIDWGDNATPTKAGADLGGAAALDPQIDVPTEIEVQPWKQPTRVAPISTRQPNGPAGVPIRPLIVTGGTQIGLVLAVSKKRKLPGQRGVDSSEPQQRRCKRCVKFNGPQSATGRGSKPRGGGEKNCEYFDGNGVAL